MNPQTGASLPAPATPRLHAPFFERDWVFWLGLYLAVKAPLVYLLAKLLKNSTSVSSVLQIAGGVGATLCLLAAAWIFEAGGPGAWPVFLQPARWQGRTLKVLAIGNAVGAVLVEYCLASDFTQGQEGGSLSWSWQQYAFTSNNEGVGFSVFLVVWLLTVAALAYLAGDARVRRARREREQEAAG